MQQDCQTNAQLVKEQVRKEVEKKEDKKEKKIGEEKGIKKGARNIIIEFKANNTAPSFIFQFVKNAYKDDLTDEEIQKMIDDVEENE